MNLQCGKLLDPPHHQTKANGTIRGKTHRWLTSGLLALLVLLLPGGLLADPIVIRINDLAKRPPEIEVEVAPHGYAIYTGPDVANPAIEDGALITLFGVDAYGSIPDWGGRFVDPTPWESLPPLYNDVCCPGVNLRQYVTAKDIVWVQHDLFGPYFNGALQIGFNSALEGNWYRNPELVGDANLGPVPTKWVTFYANDIVVVQFKAQKPAKKK